MKEKPKPGPIGAESAKQVKTQPRIRDFSKSLPMTLLRARESVMRHFRPALRHFGITEQQWRILRALSGIEKIEILALAEATFLLPPSLSRILKGLDERGLIIRRTSDEDLRRGIVSISASGLELIDRAGAYSESIYAEITARYGAGNLAELDRLLREFDMLLSAGEAIASSLDLPPEPQPTAPRRGRPRKNDPEDEE